MNANRRTGTVQLVAFGAGATLVLVLYLSLRAGDALAGTGQDIPGNPVAAFLNVLGGRITWPVHATVIAIVVLLLLIGAAWFPVRWWHHRAIHTRVDHLAKSMANPSQLTEVHGASAKQKSQRLRPDIELRGPDTYGIPIGKTVRGGHTIVMSWEDVGVAFSGPRTGKTQALAIPAVCSAPGAVIATSNKRDLHDHTRGVREAVGRVWIFDLQGIATDGGPQWWIDLLRGMSSLKAARKLAGYFVSASKEDGARVDAYFDGGAQELLALHMFAAAVGGGDLLHTLGWLSDDDTAIPAMLLEAAGEAMAEEKIRSAQRLNPRQKDGLFDMARRFLNVLNDPEYAKAVLPQRRKQFDQDSGLAAVALTHDLPEFDVDRFASSTDTLYAMSLEGPDSATALTTALVGRLLDAAFVVARRSPGGRLPTPIVAVLDEAANVCKLSDLPKQYSHAGSQGVVLLTFLQSPAQAGEVWSEQKLATMRQASNMHYYGGGVDDDSYLQSISQQIGEHDVARWSSSHSNGGRSRSQSWSRETIAPISVLAALPKDRAIVMTSGNPPVLVRKAFWSEGRFAEQIRASLATYEPKKGALALSGLDLDTSTEELAS
ncbi:TraM recognition domain-containing protein [Antrihabitans sp. YC3-6]|uniref:TraM recognition domain-containing protein n=1 Tax=Antrihabitans stalagmiti TaxID=2799499 RepID=A0A934NX34_9NOCA|nr:type IV secretory system conjugative DNA transfer family protein [Antrihabitans stalagmiti]MBJ8342895.1 TraM recognition domain-containing protein [Antrihabitans stalagmiti]